MPAFSHSHEIMQMLLRVLKLSLKVEKWANIFALIWQPQGRKKWLALWKSKQANSHNQILKKINGWIKSQGPDFFAIHSMKKNHQSFEKQNRIWELPKQYYLNIKWL